MRTGTGTLWRHTGCGEAIARRAVESRTGAGRVAGDDGGASAYPILSGPGFLVRGGAGGSMSEVQTGSLRRTRWGTNLRALTCRQAPA